MGIAGGCTVLIDMEGREAKAQRASNLPTPCLIAALPVSTPLLTVLHLHWTYLLHWAS